MAAYSVASGLLGVRAKQLTATVIDTVTFADDWDRVEVFADGAAALYFTVTGVDPATPWQASYENPAGVASVVTAPVPTAGGTVVKLVSTGTPTYSVTALGPVG